MVRIMEADIEDYIEVCSYCGANAQYRYAGCCGEVHFEEAVITVEGECYLLSEVTIEEEKICKKS